MCGIVGLLSYGASPVERTVLEDMRDAMAHRGPDGADSWMSADRKIGLGHRRLSIVDLNVAATQPMRNEDGTVIITFNGEIYNHASMRPELIERGHRFCTDHSDTEVLVHGYEEWGLDGLLREPDRKRPVANTWANPRATFEAIRPPPPAADVHHRLRPVRPYTVFLKRAPTLVR